MTIELYGHPFAAFAWKPLIALYERGVPFAFRMVDPDHPENAARLAALSPTGQFPALVDGATTLAQSDAIIEYCDRFGDAPPLVPEEADEALAARMMASIFDDYVAAPMQRIVADALRATGLRDPHGVGEARSMLDRSYAWLEQRIGKGLRPHLPVSSVRPSTGSARTGSGGDDPVWATGARFTIADCAAAPALFYADWVHPIAHPALAAYRARLLARPSVARVVDEARPYRAFFPLGAPDRD